MSHEASSKISEEIGKLADSDPVALMAYLDEKEQWLREQGFFKLLAFTSFRVGRIGKAHQYLKRVSHHELDEAEQQLAGRIRHEWRRERRSRLGLPSSSGKRWSKRVVDGTRNLLRHGRLRNPTSYGASIPRHLKAISAQIRTLRSNDVGHLQSLLDRYECDYREAGHAKFLAFNFYHAGAVTKAAEYAAELDPRDLDDQEATFVSNILFEHRARKNLLAGNPPFAMDERSAPSRQSDTSPKALYLTASSRPYILSGYTSRSDAIVDAARQCENLVLAPVTRPGFPDDRSDARRPTAAEVETSRFETISSEALFRGDLEAYLAETLPLLERYASDKAVNIIHAASNFRNGAVGLALARRMGLPFVYEVRGLWEETADTKLRGWRDTERFEFERLFERFLVAEAEGVLTINSQVRDVLGLKAADNVAILPNCVSEKLIVDRGEKPQSGRLSIGYVGSILEYEGLDDLIRAAAGLQQRGFEIVIDIYGGGGDAQRLSHLIDETEAANVTLHGVVPPTRIPQLYSGFDLSVFPRKPYRVCELVTPLKPLEAMANDVNVLVSDVAPMEHLVRTGAALGFKAGNVSALQEAIENFCRMDAHERRSMRERAREVLRSSHVWERQCQVISDIYDAAVREISNRKSNENFEARA